MYLKVIKSILEVGKSITSDKYIVLVMDTIIKSFIADYKFLKYIQIFSDPVSITINNNINSTEVKQAAFALSQIINTIKKSFSLEVSADFVHQVGLQLDKETLDELKKLGFEL